MEIGTIIKNARERAGATQRQIAIKADITSEYISKIERGDATNVGLETLRKIAAALDLPMSELVADLESSVQS